jgi:hypothetical protein
MSDFKFASSKIDELSAWLIVFMSSVEHWSNLVNAVYEIER